MESLGLVLPLFDEQEAVRSVVGDLHAALSRLETPFQLVLVDNGSHDATGARVDELAATLDRVTAVHLPTNAGYGGGIRAGMVHLDTALLGWHWGDGQVSADVVVTAWQRMTGGGLDLVKAHRILRDDGPGRRLQSRGYHLVARALLGLREPDLHGCPKIFTRHAWEVLAASSDDWLLDLEVMWKAQALGFRVATVPARMAPRAFGVSKVRWSTAWRFGVALAEIRTGHPPWTRAKGEPGR